MSGDVGGDAQGQRGPAETHEIVLADVTAGAETVIEQLVTDGPNCPVRWWPRNVTWSPDGTTLFGSPWPDGGGFSQLLAVPADTPSILTVLTDANMPVGFDGDHRWALLQVWGRQPA